LGGVRRKAWSNLTRKKQTSCLDKGGNHIIEHVKERHWTGGGGKRGVIVWDVKLSRRAKLCGRFIGTQRLVQNKKTSVKKVRP